MFLNYIKTAYRNFSNNKLFTLINILGLAFGMTACLLILYYVHYEKSYDQFHQNSEQIYRLRYERTDSKGDAVRFASCCPPAAARIRGQYPEVEQIGRMLHYNAIVSYDNVKFLEERIYFSEPDIFKILDFNFTSGDPLLALSEPNNVFISHSTAKKYFGDQEPIGKTISLDKQTDYQVAGLFEDIPENSHLKFDILLPWKNLETLYGPEYYEAWGHTGSYTYVLAKPGTDPIAFEKKLLPMITAECPWLEEYNMDIDLKMQALKDIHLTSNFMQEYEPNGNRDIVNFLYIIALFIIVIAWVNYINLSTARSLTRAKEVGLRKVVGASRKQLITQFFIETLLTNTIAVLTALLFLGLSLPAFSEFIGASLSHTVWFQGWFWIAVLILFIAGVILSGIYPVFALSSFQPHKVLKGKIGNKSSAVNLRKVLIVFQFMMALFLITGTMTVFEQISFMRDQDTGFDIEKTLVIKGPRVRDEAFSEKIVTFKKSLLNQSDVGKICVVTEVPGKQIYWDAGGIMKAGEDVSKGKNYQIVGIDYDFLDVFGLKLAQGRNFSEKFPTDTDALILNETAVQWMGFENGQAALDQQVSYWGKIYKIVGVLKDYHQQSLKEKFEPHIYRLMPEGRRNLLSFALKLNTKNMSETIGMVQDYFQKFFPGNPFDYFFLDTYYDQQYKSDELFGKVFGLFSFLAIFITSLGILGLAAFMATQRTKEIGIRKVLGANVSRIFMLLTRDFLLLLSVSFILVLPLSYFGILQWLSLFANRMGLNAWIFILPMLLVMIITILTIASHTIKAALTNPVESLRYE